MKKKKKHVTMFFARNSSKISVAINPAILYTWLQAYL